MFYFFRYRNFQYRKCEYYAISLYCVRDLNFKIQNPKSRQELMNFRENSITILTLAKYTNDQYLYILYTVQ